MQQSITSKVFVFSLLLPIFFFSFFPSSLLQAKPSRIEVYETKPIRSIHISMENLAKQGSFNQKQILSKLHTKVGDPFSQLTFDRDLKMLSEEYDRIEPTLIMEEGEIQIEIKIWQKPLIRNIKWLGNKKIKGSKLQKELGIQPYTLFNREDFHKAFAKVKEYYIKKGFFESDLEYKIIPYPDTNEIDIEIHVSEGHSGHISQISFSGLNKKEESAILKLITTKKYNFFTSWLTGTGTYNEEALEYDKLVIVNYLQNEGYANAQADITLTETEGGRLAIHVYATKGDLFHFGTVSISGNTLFSEKEVEDAFGISKGSLFSPDRLRDGIQRIRDLYGRDGYIEADIHYTLELVEQEPVYNIAIEIEEGTSFRIGLIHILGNVSTKSNVILRESLLIPGEVFDSRRLKATEAKLMATGYFKSVNVYPVKTPEDQEIDKNYRDVVIEVEETATGNISLSFGFSTQENVTGALELSEQNFDHRGLTKWWREGFSSLRGAGELAKARAQIGKKFQSYNLTWLDPYFLDTDWRFGFDVNYSRSRLQSNDYSIKTIGGSIFANYPINAYWTAGITWRIRNAIVKIHDIESEQAKREHQNSGIVTGISPSFAFDSTDSIIKPHRGYRSTLKLELAEVFRRSDDRKTFPFISAKYLNTYYYPLWQKGTLKARFDFQFLWPIGQGRPDLIPLSERFFLGGETTVRGYKPFRIGPKFQRVVKGKLVDTNDPTGGISATLFSLEYLQTFHRLIDVFVFIDSGAVALKRFNFPAFRSSVGLGLRLTLPNGMPVSGGWAFPINKGNKDDFQGYFFSMGGKF